MKFAASLMVVVLAVVAQGQPAAYSKGGWRALQTGEAQRNVASEEPESSNPKEHEVRRAKNGRYNTGGSDLTVERPQVSEIFFEQIWPAVEFIPAAKSAVVVVGRVIKVQPYLSSDRSRIYTEMTIAVDQLLKADEDNRVAADKTVVIDRLGGALKLKSGRIVRDGIHIDYLGHLQPGRRYVIFAQAINEGHDISLIKSYELVEGKVFTNDSRASRLISTVAGVPLTLENEATFVEAVRKSSHSPD